MADGKMRSVRARHAVSGALEALSTVVPAGTPAAEARRGEPATPPTRLRSREPQNTSALVFGSSTPAKGSPLVLATVGVQGRQGAEPHDEDPPLRDEVHDASAGGAAGDENDIDPQIGLPRWARDLDFLTEPFEGNKVFRERFVKLHPGSQLFQTHDRSAAGPIFRVCERPAHPPALPQRAGADGVGVTRHPPDTALDPQSGIAYFIRIEEGLQDKAISLKSVATGPSKHTWKMAWGRKTHLKKWGVLYKSYRCRHMYQPKCAPPPYRMQIYVLEEHDRDAARGEAPTPGIALVQILSLQDAPLRRRAGVKRELEENAEELLPTQTPAGTPGALAGAAHGAAAFPTGSGGRAVMTPVGATPLPPPHGSSAVGRRAPSVGATPLSAVAVRLDGRFTGALGPPLEPVSAPRACEVGDAGGREAVYRAAADVWVQGAPGAGARALGANPLDALEWESAAAEGSAAGNGARGGAAGAALLREAREAQAAAVAALPLHSVALAERYGGLAAPILAGMLVGSPWGLPCTCELLSGARISRPGVGGGCIPPPERVRFDAAPRELDLTALGWAKLIALYAAEEAAQA